MKKAIKNLTLMTSLVVLGACATATPYQEASAPGKFNGYSQTVIEKDRARVSFAGNTTTERDIVENYLLYRAAELTVEQGYDYFTLQERDVEERTRLQSTGSSFGNSGFGFNGFGNSRFFTHSRFGGGFGGSSFGRGGFRSSRFGGGRFGGGFGNDSFNVREITKYRATAEVRFGTGEKPAEKDNAFDARDVINNLGATIVYPEDIAQDALPSEPVEKTAEHSYSE